MVCQLCDPDEAREPVADLERSALTSPLDEGPLDCCLADGRTKSAPPSWLATSLSVTLCHEEQLLAVGDGSRLELW